MILKAWPKTWPGSTRSVSTEEKCGLVAGAEDSARVVAARVRRCALHTRASKRSSSFTAPCAAACCSRVAAESQLQPRRLVPCTAPHARAVAHSASVFAVGTMAVYSSVVALLTPETRYGRARDRADVLSGVRRALLARARPSSAVRSVTPLATHGLLLASLRDRSATEDGGRSLSCRSASTAPHMHHADRCEAQRPRRASTRHAGKGSRRRSSVSSRRWPATRWVA